MTKDNSIESKKGESIIPVSIFEELGIYNLRKELDYNLTKENELFMETMSLQGEASMNEMLEHSSYKEAESLRRHDEHIAILREQNQILLKLLEGSDNAIEQRDALIRFTVQQMIDTEPSQEGKKRTLTELLTRLSYIAAFGNDLSDLGKKITGAIDELAQEN
ncbi:hypothetical protein [Exiguobacterium sp. S22-S28]|uniref:hypothetical protein n=1 Tax=Exiguobacterium sp. S22-S28 TaxID=3342768 RepID=UPI00372D556B